MSSRVKPFEISVQEAIRSCSSTPEILVLLNLISGTIIRSEHDQIIEAIESYFDGVDRSPFEQEIDEAIKSLRLQKIMAMSSSV